MTTAADSWKALNKSLSQDWRQEAIEDLREHQRWIGTLKTVQATFPEAPGLTASCRAFILYHLSEIERITGELRKHDDD